MKALGSSIDAAPQGERRCIFCFEDIRPGASVCPHCGSNLAPLQRLVDEHRALEGRVAALEDEIAALRAADPKQIAIDDQAIVVTPGEAANRPARPTLKWPHMVDNIFLALMALLAAHYLATTLPTGGRTVFRLAALVVALPFGMRFQRNAKGGTAAQVLAAAAFGCLGTIAIGVLDLALAPPGASPPMAQDVVASVAAITLSHYAGSTFAYLLQMRSKEAATEAATPMAPVLPSDKATTGAVHIEPARIKSAAEAVKALYDAVTPLAAAAAALWAAFGHSLF